MKCKSEIWYEVSGRKQCTGENEGPTLCKSKNLHFLAPQHDQQYKCQSQCTNTQVYYSGDYNFYDTNAIPCNNTCSDLANLVETIN